MPTRAPRACPHCGSTYTTRRCQVCYPPWADTTWHTQKINTNRWQRIKARRLRANPICQTCQQRLADEVDHIHNLASGGAAYDYDNTQSLCTPCHAEKTSREASQARWTPRLHT